MSKKSTDKHWLLSKQGKIAFISATAIFLHLLFRWLNNPYAVNYPLYAAYILGGLPILIDLFRKVRKFQFGSDFLAGIAIVASFLQAEYLAGTFIILMLSGGEALEEYATRRASSVLNELSKRMPQVARLQKNGKVSEVSLDLIEPGDTIELLPHAICPVDGEVVKGSSHMDESFLTGEPYVMPKIPGSAVISGAINHDSLLLIKACAYPSESRYQKIAKVIQEQEKNRAPIKRLADKLGAWYTPLALAIALLAWMGSGDASRFLAVLVTATPCPLLIAIPVSLIGSISTAASRGIIIKNPAILEIIPTCQAIFFDKTGTLTQGKPELTKIYPLASHSELELLSLIASLEEYSKHPLAGAVRSSAIKQNCPLKIVDSVTEKAGQGLTGIIDSSEYTITNRKSVKDLTVLPQQESGLECVLLENKLPIGMFIFQDQPRKDGYGFIRHTKHHHGIKNIKILSGDKFSEVQRLASQVGVTSFEAELSPEDKLVKIRSETNKHRTIYIGDGINDAPALQAASVGIAIGSNSEITNEAAGAVILDSSLEKVDELIHISERMRRIAFQSAIGGMGLSIVAMIFASIGLLTPLAGALIQEGIDVFAVLNALRTAYMQKDIHHKFNITGFRKPEFRI